MRDSSDDDQTLAYRFAHVPLPDDAVECEPRVSRGANDWRRLFLTREWDIAGLWVSVAGEQNHHGQITRWLHVSGDDRCTSSDRERLVAALLDAGQLLDSLSRPAGVRRAAG